MTYGALVRDFGSVASVADTISEAALAGINPFSVINTAAGAEYGKMLEMLADLDEDNMCISIIKGEDK